MIVFKLDSYALLQMLSVKLMISESERYTYQELQKARHVREYKNIHEISSASFVYFLFWFLFILILFPIVRSHEMPESAKLVNTLNIYSKWYI